MPQATFHFPTGFLWGTATAAHQVEGNSSNNNWSAWEAGPGHIINDHRSGLACDWWGGRWKEDLDRAAETGQNAHRFSVEWSRIQPNPDRWDEDALDYYRQILRGMAERGITPMVTLHHFTDPLWLAERGGWENEETPALFAAFTRRVVDALKEYCTLWTTINEPNVYTYSGYIEGMFPPGKKDSAAAFQVMRNLVRGHAGAYRVIHEVQRQARAGIALNYRGFLPAHPGFPADQWMCNLLSQNYNDAFNRALVDGRLNFLFKHDSIPEAAHTQDFIGVNYYTTDLVSFRPLAAKNFFHSRAYPKNAPLSTTGFIAHVPTGMWQALEWAKGFNLPILITENGVEDVDDRLRPRYLIEHLHQIWRGVNFNWPIKGYFHWSLVDNFEWERGWTQRFGLWGLDVETQARIRRPSVDLYAAVCQSNAISYDLVDKYSPASLPLLFP